MNNLKKRDPHQMLRIQATINVFIKQKHKQNNNRQKNRAQTTQLFRILGSFWEAKKHDKLRLLENMKMLNLYCKNQYI